MSENMSENKLQSQINEEREAARNACDTTGANSKECAAAWDAVEELQAEAAHKKTKPEKTSFETYCDNNPDAAECRVYDD